jgi:hypothetical protein
LKIRVSARTMIAAALLAAGSLAAAAATALAAPAPGHGTPGTPDEPCSTWAKTHTFVWIGKAAGSARTGLTVTGKMVTVHCGGPDDLQYVITGKPFAGHLLPSAKITVLSDTDGIGFPALAQAQLPRWITHDQFGGIYAVTGPFKAICDLNEEYHP